MNSLFRLLLLEAVLVVLEVGEVVHVALVALGRGIGLPQSKQDAHKQASSNHICMHVFTAPTPTAPPALPRKPLRKTTAHPLLCLVLVAPAAVVVNASPRVPHACRAATQPAECLHASTNKWVTVHVISRCRCCWRPACRIAVGS